MKTDPCKGKRTIAPVVASRIRSENEENNNLYINSAVNEPTTKSPCTELKNPDNVQNGNGDDNKTDTDELVHKLSKVKISDKDINKNQTNIEAVSKETPLIKENSEKCENDNEKPEDDLCSRGPSRIDFLSDKRTKTNPYTVPVSVSAINNTNGGAVVYVRQTAIGCDEDCMNLDQLPASLFEGVEQESAPPFVQHQISTGSSSFSDDEVLWQILDVVTDPQKREYVCARLGEDGENRGGFETRSTLGVLGSSPLPHDPMFSVPSPELYGAASPQQYQQGSSPQQIVPTYPGWREPTIKLSTSSSSPATSSNPTSPYEVPSLNKPIGTYLSDDPFLNELQLLDLQMNELDKVDFSLPNEMGNCARNEERNIQPSTQASHQPVYTPILSPPSPDQRSPVMTSKVSLMSPSEYSQTNSPQSTLSDSNEISISIPNGYISPQSTTPTHQVRIPSTNNFTSNIACPVSTSVASHVGLPNIPTTEETNPFHMKSVAHNQNAQNTKPGSSQTTVPLVSINGYPQNIPIIPSTSPHNNFGQPTTVGFLIPVVNAGPKQITKQTCMRSRLRTIFPARKETNVPSREDLLQKLDRLKKKDAWLRVNMKSEAELTKGDADGDTMLMILVSRESDYLYEFVYALVEYLRRHYPDNLNKKNVYNQTALYNSCILLPQHPLIPRYLAETLLSLDVNIAEDKFEGGKTLVECVKQHGETHAEVLKVLLNLKTSKGTPVFSP